MRGGLTRTTIVASAALALVVGAAFGILVHTIAEQRDSAARATRAQQAIAAADRLERLVLDLETGQRGYLVAREPRFLTPWQAARAQYRRAGEELVAASDGAVGPAREIVAAVDAYVRDYSVPLVAAARRGDGSARSAESLDEGRRRVNAIRGRFDAFMAAERRSFAAREDRADAAARRAIIVATAGLIGSIVLIVMFGGYLTRAVALPVRRAAAMARRLAGGDLATRVPETSSGEVGTLERSFNTMAGSLEASRDELGASRARVVVTADETRRRIERDLHDGAQQRLVHTVITLKLALRELEGSGPAAARVRDALEQAERATAELRDLAHGILPAALTRGGLSAGVGTLLSRIRLPVSVDVTDERLPPGLEATAYFIVAEALTNTVKHAQASRAEVKAVVQDGVLLVEVSDDGVGGAQANGSAGLLGLSDRAAALDGELRIESPLGRGTTVTATLPIAAA